ncbi:MAG: cytokinin riboside 5'-monophosphate phosphoribohydrolase [Chitinophagales bacterium]|nr:MAG: cytokinin riboside 5'-monophosphate phosphoribohydrolase [Chitinophagales bacterium]
MQKRFNKKMQLREKSWTTELKAQSSWQIFKVMSEFVEGFEKLNKIGPCISIFGSARTTEGNKYYDMAVELAKKLVEEGYGIITGGGPGIMEAANRGAFEAGGKSVGLNIDLPHEQEPNIYIDFDKLITFKYFFSRKVMFVKYAQAFVLFPGGLGTMDEFFECLTLIQTRKIDRFPVICVGRDYWEGLLEWMQQTMLEKFHNIDQEDLKLITLVDTVDEAVEFIRDYYRAEHPLKPNF